MFGSSEPCGAGVRQGCIEDLQSAWTHRDIRDAKGAAYGSLRLNRNRLQPLAFSASAGGRLRA